MKPLEELTESEMEIFEMDITIPIQLRYAHHVHTVSDPIYACLSCVCVCMCACVRMCACAYVHMCVRVG